MLDSPANYSLLDESDVWWDGAAMPESPSSSRYTPSSSASHASTVLRTPPPSQANLFPAFFDAQHKFDTLRLDDVQPSLKRSPPKSPPKYLPPLHGIPITNSPSVALDAYHLHFTASGGVQGVRPATPPTSSDKPKRQLARSLSRRFTSKVWRKKGLAQAPIEPRTQSPAPSLTSTKSTPLPVTAPSRKRHTPAPSVTRIEEEKHASLPVPDFPAPLSATSSTCSADVLDRILDRDRAEQERLQRVLQPKKRQDDWLMQLRARQSAISRSASHSFTIPSHPPPAPPLPPSQPPSPIPDALQDVLDPTTPVQSTFSLSPITPVQATFAPSQRSPPPPPRSPVVSRRPALKVDTCVSPTCLQAERAPDVVSPTRMSYMSHASYATVLEPVTVAKAILVRRATAVRVRGATATPPIPRASPQPVLLQAAPRAPTPVHLQRKPVEDSMDEETPASSCAASLSDVSCVSAASGTSASASASDAARRRRSRRLSKPALPLPPRNASLAARRGNLAHAGMTATNADTFGRAKDTFGRARRRRAAVPWTEDKEDVLARLAERPPAKGKTWGYV